MTTPNRSDRTLGGLSRRDFMLAAIGISAATLATIGSRFASATEPGPTAATAAALSSAQAEYREATAQLRSLNEQVEQAQYALSQTEAQLDETNAAISDLEQSITQKQGELAEAQDVLASRIGANYKAGKTDALEVILGSTDFEDFVNRVFIEGKVSDDDAAAIQKVKDLKAELETQQNDLLAKRAEQEELVDQQKADAQALDDQLASMQSYANSLSSDVVALMAQAQAETEAARQAQYEQYIAQLAAQQAAAAQASQGVSDGGAGGGAAQTTSNTGGGASQGAVDQAPADVPSAPAPEPAVPSYSEPEPSYPTYTGTGNHAGSVVDIAFGYIGVPYVWGGTSPSGFDCSGLCQYCYAQAGYSIPRDTYSQIARIQSLGNWKTSMSDLQPGDLAFPHEGHVGIYCGGGMWIHAPYPGESVQYTSVYAFIGGGSPI